VRDKRDCELVNESTNLMDVHVSKTLFRSRACVGKTIGATTMELCYKKKHPRQ
jgi:hypothetical protein